MLIMVRFNFITKWRAIKKLEEDKLIEVKENTELVPSKNNLSKEEN